MTREQLIKVLHTSSTFHDNLEVTPHSVLAVVKDQILSVGEVEFLNETGLDWGVECIKPPPGFKTELAVFFKVSG